MDECRYVREAIEKIVENRDKDAAENFLQKT